MRRPNLIIAGVNKAGTSSLFSYLATHPEICASSIKETCYFLPLRYGKDILPTEQYMQYFEHCKNHKYILEATPGYYYGHDFIAKEIYRTLGDVKIIILFRDPVDRLVSFYKYIKGRILISKNMSFQEYVVLCEEYLERMKDSGIEKNEDYIYTGIIEGYYSNYLKAWYKYFEGSIKILFFEDLKKNTLSFMSELCNWLEIDSSVYSDYNFTIENRSVLYRNNTLHKIGLYTNKKIEKFLRKAPYIKRTLRDIYYGLNEVPQALDIPYKTLDYVRSLYHPYTKQLFHILKEKGYDTLPDWLYVK